MLLRFSLMVGACVAVAGCSGNVGGTDLDGGPGSRDGGVATGGGVGGGTGGGVGGGTGGGVGGGTGGGNTGGGTGGGTGDGGTDGGTGGGTSSGDSGVMQGGDGGTVVVDAGPAPADDGGLYGIDARPANPTCIAPAPPATNSGVTTKRVFSKLTFAAPMGMFNAPGNPNRNYVLERDGVIQTFPNTQDAGTDVKTVALDLSSKVNTTGEGGLLGLAFHPDWSNNHQVFIAYSEDRVSASTLRLVISRFRSNDSGLTFDAAGEEVIMKLDKPDTNHNGGSISFGPDGYLYIGFGDGGGSNNYYQTGRRMSTLLSKMIRIDVNVPISMKYAIPPTNPFASTGVVCNRTTSNWDIMPNTVTCAEIYAMGFRNPWRWSFDTENGEMWVGDVGQGTWEEVDKVSMGGDYGWAVREGAHCFGSATCSTAGLIDPITEYDHSQGYAITGGFVYHGNTLPTLAGKFIYGDYVTNQIWVVGTNATTGLPEGQKIAKASDNISSFAQLLDGEVYIMGFSSGGIHQLVPSGAQPPDTFPKVLSATGCFKASDPRVPVAALVPYEPRAQLWSDGASKERYFAIPDGSKITALADGDFDLPNGSVAAKTFYLNGKRIETRLMMRHSTGAWAGYTYEWNDAETDATLLAAGKTKTVGTQTWTYPSRAQCLACHTGAANRTLGLEAAQLNFSFLYPSTGRVRNQLSTLVGLGYFTSAVPAVTPLADPFGADPVEARARSYLHANCSICHRLGAGQGPQDFRYSLTTAMTNSCNVAPSNGDLGVSGAKIFVPNDPSHSLISLRMKALDVNRMPPLGSVVVHTQGTALIDSWITSMAQCPQ